VSTTARLRWGILVAGGIARTVGADIAGSSASVVAAVASRDAAGAADLAAALGASAGEIDSRLMPFPDSLAVLEVLDDVRRNLGVRYEADEES
jgi:hypothetical protein